MELGLSNGIFCKHKLEENFALVKQLGFENLEFNMKSVEVEDDVSVYTAEKLLKDYGLNCLTLHAATLYVKDEVEIHRAVYYGKISADFAYRLGAKVMVIHSNVSRKLPREVRNAVLTRIFKELKPYAQSLGLKLGLENLTYAASGYGKNVAEFEEVFRVIGMESMGVTLDFCHSTATGTTDSLIEKFSDRLLNVHVANRRHAPLVEGTPELVSLFKKLQALGYDGPVNIELSRRCSLKDILETKRILESVLAHSSKKDVADAKLRNN